MDFPIVTKQLALRVGKSEADHFKSWLKVMQAWQGNRFGIEIQRFGDAVALVNTGATLGPLFNRVLEFGDTDAEFLEEIVQFYEARDLPCRIDINPYNASPALMRRLTASGLNPFRFHAHLYGMPSPLPLLKDAAKPAIEARQIRPEELALWSRAWRAGFAEALGVPEEIADHIAEATQRLFEEPGWCFSLAFAEGQPAAAGALYAQDGAASLVSSGTLPEFRRRGCQMALLQARMAEASRLGCDLVVAQAGLDTTSQHNMERAGLRIAYTRAFWLRP